MSVVIPTYQRLNELAIPVTAEEWNNLCWHGAQNGHAAAVLFACDNAVALAPENGNYRDSRGVARALIGDMAGAIEDIEFAIQWAERVNEQADFIAQRQTWLVGLKLLQPFATGR